MTILDNTGEPELVQLLNIIQELSEQLTQSRSLSIALHASAGTIKVCTLPASLADTKSAPQSQATHSQTGFVLRRCV